MLDEDVKSHFTPDSRPDSPAAASRFQPVDDHWQAVVVRIPSRHALKLTPFKIEAGAAMSCPRSSACPAPVRPHERTGRLLESEGLSTFRGLTWTSSIVRIILRVHVDEVDAFAVAVIFLIRETTA